jgi:ribosomal protein S6--L-glutamate ligase
VARPFPVRTAGEKRGEPRTIIPEVRDICLRCGELFDLELYGVDLIETEDGPYVIEVNCFPGYKGVPEADRLLAEYIFERAAESRSPETRSPNVAQAMRSSS